MAVGDWYRWGWRKWPAERWGEPGRRKGQRCKLLAVGSRDSALVEFEDGLKVRTDRKGLRRLWGISQWIGGGWCELVYRRSPEVATGGRGVVVVPPRQTPDISTNVAGKSHAGGRGMHSVTANPARKRPMSGPSREPQQLQLDLEATP